MIIRGASALLGRRSAISRPIWARWGRGFLGFATS